MVQNSAGKLLQRLAESCCKGWPKVAKIGRKMLLYTIGKRLENLNLYVTKTSTQSFDLCRDASANVDREASTFWWEASVDQDHVVCHILNFDQRLQPFWWDASSRWRLAKGVSMDKIKPLGVPFRRRWGSAVNDQYLTKLAQKKRFKSKKNSTNFYASERAHDLFTPASKRAIGIDKLAQKHVWQIRADTPIFEAKIYTKSLAGKYCKNSAGS